MMRQGKSILEVLIVVTILVLLISLVLSAVQKVRASAALVQSENNLRQQILATHSLIEANNGKIKYLQKNELYKPIPLVAYNFSGSPLFGQLLIYLGLPTFTQTSRSYSVWDHYADIGVPNYLSPADPTLNQVYRAYGTHPDAPQAVNHTAKISYAFNAQLFDDTFDINSKCPDGTSVTLAFGEKSWFSKSNYSYYDTANNKNDVYVCCYSEWNRLMPNDHNSAANTQRAGFADLGDSQIVPVKNAQGEAVGAEPFFEFQPRSTKTFYHRPRLGQSYCDRLQSHHPAGLPVAMLDGSVRVLHPKIAETTFWSMVTPNGGEYVAFD